MSDCTRRSNAGANSAFDDMYYRDQGQVTDQSCHDQTGNILVSPSARKIKEVVNLILNCKQEKKEMN